MLLTQVRAGTGERAVVVTDTDQTSWLLKRWRTVYELASVAINRGVKLQALALQERKNPRRAVDLSQLAETGFLLAPIDHPDPAHLLVSGTGLTHLGSAASRDAMHATAKRSPGAAPLTDSMKMFQMGLKGGRPRAGRVGVQPEWFYKGDGTSVVAPGQPLTWESFAQDAGEEPEVAGIYVIGRNGNPYRVGFVLLNEFSDHLMERENYLWLAHSKLRQCAFGPQLLVGDLPQDLRGTSRIHRGRRVIFEQTFLTGEANMSHSLANLEWHHFKYTGFRRPGDVHVHTFGTATLSFSSGVRTRPGDRFELQAPAFGLPLINPVVRGKPVRPRIQSLYG